MDEANIWALVDELGRGTKDRPVSRKATIDHVDADGTMWVNLPGSDEPTPAASFDAEAQPGDTVTVDWRNNALHVSGNETQPATSTSAVERMVAPVAEKVDGAYEAASSAQQAAVEAAAVASATGQHFWDDDSGAHVTEVTKTEWLEAENAGFPDLSETQQYPNSLWNSIGMLFRSALTNLVSITRSAVSFFDGQGNDAENITAQFGADGAVIGKEADTHVVIDSDSFDVKHASGTEIFSAGSYSGEVASMTYTNLFEKIWDKTHSSYTFQLPYTPVKAISYLQVVGEWVFSSAVQAYVEELDASRYTLNKSTGALTITKPPSITFDTDYVAAEVRVVFTLDNQYLPYITLGTRQGSLVKSYGLLSSSFGQSNMVPGTASMAVGTLCEANGDNSLAVGVRAKAIGQGSLAVGQDVSASGDGAVALGDSVNATNGGLAVGRNVIADNSAAIGYDNVTVGSGTNSAEVIFHTANNPSDTSISRTAISAYDKGNTYGHDLVIGSGDVTVLGAGEFAQSLYQNEALPGETLHIGADGAVYLHSNGNTIANRKTWQFGTDGSITPPNDALVLANSKYLKFGYGQQLRGYSTSVYLGEDDDSPASGDVQWRFLKSNGAIQYRTHNGTSWGSWTYPPPLSTHSTSTATLASIVTAGSIPCGKVGNCAYVKLSNITTGAISARTTIGTLPASYRPPVEVQGYIQVGSAQTVSIPYITITAAGLVRVDAKLTNAYGYASFPVVA